MVYAVLTGIPPNIKDWCAGLVTRHREGIRIRSVLILLDRIVVFEHEEAREHKCCRHAAITDMLLNISLTVKMADMREPALRCVRNNNKG